MSEVSESEITRLARAFVKKFGEGAPNQLYAKRNEFLARGDCGGAIICGRLVGAVHDLLNLEPASLLVH